MVEYIFGNYLVESGRLSAAQLANVMQQQDRVRVRLGLIAVSEGMMTREQADEVNALQANMDMRFGDIAVSRGYLTDEQVSRLLKKQGNSYLTFVQTLIDDGYLAIDEIDAVMEEFRVTNGYSRSDIAALKSDNVDRIVPLFIPEEASQYVELISTVVRTAIRLIDRHIYIGKAEITDTFPSERLRHVSQTLNGWGGTIDGFAEGDGALLTLCSIFGQEDFLQLDLDALDAAGEFLNCINGIYASSLSAQGCFLELLPPDYEPLTAALAPSVCKTPFWIGNRHFYFITARAAY